MAVKERNRVYEAPPEPPRPVLGWAAQEFLDMYKRLTDPDIIEANIQVEKRKKWHDQRKSDTGL